VIGAFDQRIALTMPIESGSGGAPAFRSIASETGSQPLSSAYSEQPWLGDAFGSFTGSPNNLPVDMHEMVGMVAPRGLLIMENPHIDWLGAKSGSVAALGGAEVYKALGAGDNITYWSDVQDGTHCAVRPEWKIPLQQNLQKFLPNTGSAAGSFHISTLKAGNLAQWRDWTTPTLTDGTASPTSSPTVPTDPPTSTVPTTPVNPALLCRVTDDIFAWDTGFTADFTVTNTGTTAVNGWAVGFTLPAGQAITGRLGHVRLPGHPHRQLGQTGGLHPQQQLLRGKLNNCPARVATPVPDGATSPLRRCSRRSVERPSYEGRSPRSARTWSRSRPSTAPGSGHRRST
jgi:Cellulose binding domain